MASRITQHVIDAALQAWEAGAPIAEVCRHGASEALLVALPLALGTPGALPPLPVAKPVLREARLRGEVALAAATRDALRLALTEPFDLHGRERVRRAPRTWRAGR